MSEERTGKPGGRRDGPWLTKASLPAAVYRPIYAFGRFHSHPVYNVQEVYLFYPGEGHYAKKTCFSEPICAHKGRQVTIGPAEVVRRSWLERTPEASTNEDPVFFDTGVIPWWAWVKRFHLPEAEKLNGKLPSAADSLVDITNWKGSPKLG
jgi:hypothetical protein